MPKVNDYLYNKKPMASSERVRQLAEGNYGKGPVFYWMSRDQRVHDNWALLYAHKLSNDLRRPLAVVFCLVPEFLGATLRQYAFMLKGLEEVSKELAKFNIPFVVVKGEPPSEVSKLAEKNDASLIVSDFSPLRIYKAWKKKLLKHIRVPFYEVDAHNIVPCWAASPKQEYGAYTMRPKIHRLLELYLHDFPRLKKQGWPAGFKRTALKWAGLRKFIKVDESVSEVGWIRPGEEKARKVLKDFLENRLGSYSKERNDPNKRAQSNLSPYLHFGQISAQRIALEVMRKRRNDSNRRDFLEELIVRRELADNFCYYNENYDSVKSFPSWAIETLKGHLSDEREYVYSKDRLENAETHDELWNAAQIEMVKTGKMHGFMRMYWAKKILEWTRSPEEAVRFAVYLNDKYELDGRDPNGYAGIAWSIGGVHDRAWNSRAVFGKIRYMSFNGCKSKFDVKKYIEKYSS